MLTRSKIKMQQSVRQVHHDLPYFNNEEEHTPKHMYKQTKNPNGMPGNNYSDIDQHHYRTDFFQYNQGDSTPKRNNPSRNQILKELRQEYEILRNLSVQDNINIHTKRYQQQEGAKFSQSSSVSSSVHSNKGNRRKQGQRQYGSPKLNSKELQSIHLEKKQLQIVIGNSMRKIEELLNNEILLKKTIHQLKNQIEGKGGVHQEYEKAIKALKKSEEELQEELNKAKHQNEKILQKSKEITEKIRYFQGQLTNKERQIKQGYEEQRKLHQLIRIEKDKYLNIEIQCKTYKMQFDLLEKEKNNQMNRLIRQFESKQGGNQKQMAYIIKKLEQDIKDKDKKYHQLLIEVQQYKKDQNYQTVVDKKNQKNYLEELMYKSRSMNETNNKALTDSMNLIFVKMAELQKKSDVTLKRQIESLRKKTDENKRSTNQTDLLARVTELEKMIDKEVSQKNRLAEDIKNLKDHKYGLEDKNRELEKKSKDLHQRELQLRQQIQELEQIKGHFDVAVNERKNLQEELPVYTQKIRSLQSEIQGHQAYVNNLSVSFKDKEKKYEDQIRVLRRKIDEAQFETQKGRKEAQFNVTILRTQHEVQVKRIVEQNVRITQKLKQTEQSLASIQTTGDSKVRQKQSESASLKNVIQSIKQKSQEDLNNQKQFYSQKITVLENKHSQYIQIFNDKFVAVSSANQKLLVQISTYSRMQTELIEIRRALKQTRTINASINHLWDIKEAEYSNINDILNSLKVA